MKIKWFCLFTGFFICSLSVHGADFSVSDLNYGLRVNFPVLEGGFYKAGEKQNFGASFFNDKLFKKTLFSVKIGKLNSGGSLSVLKTPFFNSNPGAFGTVKTETPSLSSGIASFNSFPEKDSFYVHLGYADKKKFLSRILAGFVFNEEKGTCGNLSLDFNFAKKTKGSFNWTMLALPVSERNNSSWFNSRFYFHEDSLLNNLLGVSLSSENFSSVVIACLYENAFRVFCVSTRSEFKLKLNHFIFTFRLFYNPNDNVFLPSATYMDRRLQGGGGIVYKNKYKMNIYKIGINSLFNNNVQSDELTAKISAGGQISNSLFSLNLSTLLNMDFNSENKKGVIQSVNFNLTNNWYLNLLNVNCICTIGLTPKSDYVKVTQKYGTGLYYGKKHKIGWNNSFTVESKKAERSAMTLASGININLKFKEFTAVGKVSFNWDL